MRFTIHMRQESLSSIVPNPLGYCPICNDDGKMREKRPDGFTFCVRGHKYLSQNALRDPIGGFCQECHQPTEDYIPHSEENGEYVNKHIHPASSIPPRSS